MPFTAVFKGSCYCYSLNCSEVRNCSNCVRKAPPGGLSLSFSVAGKTWVLWNRTKYQFTLKNISGNDVVNYNIENDLCNFLFCNNMNENVCTNYMCAYLFPCSNSSTIKNCLGHFLFLIKLNGKSREIIIQIYIQQMLTTKLLY